MNWGEKRVVSDRCMTSLSRSMTTSWPRSLKKPASPDSSQPSLTVSSVASWLRK